MMSVKTDAEKAAKRGRGFQCVRSMQRGVENINTKSRLEDHIRKTHLTPDQLPFYCALCLFRCTRREDLYRHVTHYNWHAARLADEKGNRIPDSPDYLVENPNPYIIGSTDSDYIKLSKGDSRVHLLLRQKGVETTLPSDFIARAAEEITNPMSEIEELLAVPTFEVTPPTISQDLAVQPLWKAFLSFMEGTRPPAVSITASQLPSATSVQPVLASNTATCQPTGLFAQPIPPIDTSQLPRSLFQQLTSGIQPPSTSETST